MWVIDLLVSSIPRSKEPVVRLPSSEHYLKMSSSNGSLPLDEFYFICWIMFTLSAVMLGVVAFMGRLFTNPSTSFVCFSGVFVTWQKLMLSQAEKDSRA